MFAVGRSGDIRTMEIRRPLAAVLTALALFGGGATLTACDAAGQDQNDGTTDDSNNDSGNNQDETDQDPGGGQDDVNN
jgi:hypothetical protein